MECPICLDKIRDKITLPCGHHFNKECLIMSIESNSYSCPYCRDKITQPIIIFKSKNHLPFYKFIKYQRRSTIFKNEEICFIEKNLLNYNQNPYGWLRCNSGRNYYYPIYKIKDTDYKITLFLRCCLLYSNQKINILEKKTIDNEIINYTYHIFLGHDINIFRIIFEWVYDVMMELKQNYNFTYDSYLNALIIDLYFKSIIHFNITNKLLFQTAIIVSIRNCIKNIHNLYIEDSILISYTDNSCNIELLHKIDKFQNQLFKDIIIDKL